MLYAGFTVIIFTIIFGGESPRTTLSHLSFQNHAHANNLDSYFAIRDNRGIPLPGHMVPMQWPVEDAAASLLLRNEWWPRWPYMSNLKCQQSQVQNVARTYSTSLASSKDEQLSVSAKC